MATVRFLVFRWVLKMLRLGPNAEDDAIEIAVLRHQPAILQRQVSRPRYHDRRILSMLARHLPRARWGVFLVTPATVLRWQRQRIRRHWAQPPRPARRRLDDDTVELLLRLARENPRWGYVRIAGRVRQSRDESLGDFGAQRAAPPPPPAGHPIRRADLG